MVNVTGREREYVNLGDFQSQFDKLEAVLLVNPEQALKQALKIKDGIAAEVGLQPIGESDTAYATLPAHGELKRINQMIGRIAGEMKIVELSPYIDDEVVKKIAHERMDVQSVAPKQLAVAQAQSRA